MKRLCNIYKNILYRKWTHCMICITSHYLSFKHFGVFGAITVTRPFKWLVGADDSLFKIFLHSLSKKYILVSNKHVKSTVIWFCEWEKFIILYIIFAIHSVNTITKLTRKQCIVEFVQFTVFFITVATENIENI